MISTCCGLGQHWKSYIAIIAYPKFTSAIINTAKETLSEPCLNGPLWFKLSRPALIPLIATCNFQQATLKLIPTAANYLAFVAGRKKIKIAVWTANLR